ncbi:hypothetical protein [Bdellovibrio svalbardensis]|uniref:Fimbrial protein n=1 Tax=Bdellovibrio svalbardensis TaxID=2972972 RepID=A0ABT6DD49_9BACT|nr:hypothetical protein [Bdellovibrio svalbardensis]MDG0814748.1 hypothetical protein [Bdellovibrio svalbardensis]
MHMKSVKFAAALLSTMAVGTSAIAAYGPTGTLTISGVVTAVTELEVTAAPDATTLNILAGETDKLVASVSERSNNIGGYKVTLTSVNNGQLVNGANATLKTAYKIGYDGGTKLSLTNSATQVKNVTALTGLTTVASAMRVEVTALPTAAAGTYSDTITVAITAN